MAVCPNCHETNPEAGASCPRCEGFHYVPQGALENAETDPMIGRLAANKYVILDLISEGGMGAVYRALQLPVEREVAFKVLRTELKDSDNGRDRFIREARAVSRLNHPNIITLYDFGFDEGRHPYMVMEYAPGKSLAGWLKSEDASIDRLLRIAAQILSALKEAHERGIVHRDLKPENMIVTPKANDFDRVKLLDFGIARLINEGQTRGLTREGEVFGTPDYMAPEQAQGKKSIGPPADVYAVGIILWEMLCGECPFEAPTPLAVLFMHINDPLPELRPRPGLEVPPGMWEVIQQATAKAPQERYQSASEMLNDLSHILMSVTGAHPGVLTGELSAEYSFDSAGTVPTGLVSERVRSATPPPGRSPHFTPTTGPMGSDVDVHDPDSSHVESSEEEAGPPDSARKLKIVAGVLFATVVVVAVVTIGVAFSSGDAEAEGTGDEAVATKPTPEETAEVAVKDKASETDEIEVEPIEAPTVDDEPDDEPEAATDDEGSTDEPENGEPESEAEGTEGTEKTEPKAEPKREPKVKEKPKPPEEPQSKKKKPKPREKPKAEPQPWKKTTPVPWKKR